MPPYKIRFYENIVQYHDTLPCAFHNRTSLTLGEAKAVAMEMMPKIRGKYGS